MADEPQEGRIILYQEDGRNVPVEVTYWRETFWLTQQKMAELFNVTVPTINEHLKNIFSSGELTETSTIRKSRIVRQEGSRQVSREISFYNLDAIIAVGYRVNSRQATQFRQWATGILREYIVKGFALNDDMLKNGRPFGDDYFEELLDRIRDIRTSERRFWQKVTDLFSEVSYDYDPNSQTARDFFASCQNKMHYAVTHQTAAEIVMNRVDAGKPNMGLTTWKGAPKGHPRSTDVTVAKNYLNEGVEHAHHRSAGPRGGTSTEPHPHQHGGMRHADRPVHLPVGHAVAGRQRQPWTRADETQGPRRVPQVGCGTRKRFRQVRQGIGRNWTVNDATLTSWSKTLGVRVEERRLAGDRCGIYYDPLRLIILDERLAGFQRRCTLCHELIHARHHDPGCGSQYGVKCERRCRRETALALISPVDYGMAEEIYEGAAWPMAVELGVTVQVLMDYRQLLHDSGVCMQ